MKAYINYMVLFVVMNVNYFLNTTRFPPFKNGKQLLEICPNSEPSDVFIMHIVPIYQLLFLD
jgi:hypothetical protein